MLGFFLLLIHDAHRLDYSRTLCLLDHWVRVVDEPEAERHQRVLRGFGANELSADRGIALRDAAEHHHLSGDPGRGAREGPGVPIELHFLPIRISCDEFLDTTCLYAPPRDERL